MSEVPQVASLSARMRSLLLTLGSNFFRQDQTASSTPGSSVRLAQAPESPGRIGSWYIKPLENYEQMSRLDRIHLCSLFLVPMGTARQLHFLRTGCPPTPLTSPGLRTALGKGSLRGGGQMCEVWWVGKGPGPALGPAGRSAQFPHFASITCRQPAAHLCVRECPRYLGRLTPEAEGQLHISLSFREMI